MIRRIFLAAAIAASMAGIATPAAAVVYVQVAPPPPRVEAVPQPRRGYVWAPGHWEWRHKHHVWVGGTWVRARRGYAYSPPEWRERGGRWYMQQGRWARGDNDRDGVPNGMDRSPNNPNRQ